MKRPGTWSLTRALLAFLLTTASARALSAQRLEISGRGELATDTIIERIARSGTYRLIDADTVLPASDTIRGNVVFAATTIKLENVIIGDVAIIDANVFLRPGSRITGDVVNIGGALFRAPGVVIEGSVTEYREVLYFAERTRDGVRVTGTRVSSTLDLDGFWGFHVPEYDRVAGLSLRLGARYLPPRIGTSEPEIHAWVGYQTARERLIGGAETAIRNGVFRFAVGADRDVYTNEAWVRGRMNGFSYFARGRDYRDYYAADRYYAGPSLNFRAEDRSLTVALTAAVEDAHSLPSLNPFHLSGLDTARVNPPIDDGRISSLALSAHLRWTPDYFWADVGAMLEGASTVLGGDFRFARFQFGGQVALNPVADHTLFFKVQLRGPLPGTDSLPGQRQSTIGGRATLYTLDQGTLRGDRVVYSATEYSIPVPGLPSFRLFGHPAIELIHRVGNAWRFGEDPDFIQNLGVRLRTKVAYLMYITDPGPGGSGRWVGAVSLPRRYPWQPE